MDEEQIIYGVPTDAKPLTHEQFVLKNVRFMCNYWLDWCAKENKKDKPHKDVERVYWMAKALEKALNCDDD